MTNQPNRIRSIRILWTECATEVDAMVCREFQTPEGWASAFAAIARDALAYGPGSACNKVAVKVSFANGDTRTLGEEVRADSTDPYPARAWA